MTYSSHNSQEHAMELKDNGQIRSIIYPLNIAFKPSMSRRSAVWFLFPFPAAHQSLLLGIISRVARLKTTVGPNWNKFTVTHGRQWWPMIKESAHTQWTPNNRLQCIRIRSRPNGHRDLHITLVTPVSDIMYKNTTALSHATSHYSPVRFRPAPQSIAGRPEHRNGSISARTTQNRVIRVALASLGDLLSWLNRYLI